MAIDLNLTNEISGNQLAIYQGATYKSLIFFHPEDLSLWTPRGQIRANYLNLNGQLLADFSFAPLTWGLVAIDNVQVNRTTIMPILPHTVTQNIPVPRARAEGEAFRVGRSAWVYDLELVSPSGTEVLKLARGLVDVIAEVTGVVI